LTALAIRDVVLIERLDLAFGPGLTVLTGETGAGKSILLDSLGLALGARADSGLVRRSAPQATVTARFQVSETHPSQALLQDHGLELEDELVLRRVVSADGKSRAYINDQMVAAALLRRVGAMLVEVQGQHEQIGLADVSGHAALLDSFGVSARLRETVAAQWREAEQAQAALDAARTAIAHAERDREWLEHVVADLERLAPEEGEEDRLAATRQKLQQDERRADAIASAASELSRRERHAATPIAAVRAAARALQRLPGAAEDSQASEALNALAQAEEALAEAENLLNRMTLDLHGDTQALERAEERLFALRAAARKHGVAVVELPSLLDDLRKRLSALHSGADEIEQLQARATAARRTFQESAQALGKARRDCAKRLEAAVARELPPLRLDRARFVVEITPLDEQAWGPAGVDAVRFLIATNPGQQPGPLAKVASGGELSRLMLALRVILSGSGSIPTLVFDEVDSGVGGATAAAVGDRLSRVAADLQVLVVTHSPQVASRGATHMRVSKQAHANRVATLVEPLDAPSRREEIARMLAGETVTEAARAAADELLGSPA
jgi:DNA repair protein RecN (Recombination protein N)